MIKMEKVVSRNFIRKLVVPFQNICFESVKQRSFNTYCFSKHKSVFANSSTIFDQVKNDFHTHRVLQTPVMAPDIARPAPDFEGTAVVNGAFKNIKLNDYKGKYVVLFFYPLDFTFVCPTEIIAFSERADEFRRINCELVACSTDSHFSHLAWINTPRKDGGLGKMNIPLLADKSCKIAKDYGVLKEDEGLTFRGLFIIDGNGTLRQITINDLPVGRSVDETLRLVQAFQYTDKHGEVCPAGWKPGDATMKPDPEGSKDYFKKQ